MTIVCFHCKYPKTLDKYYKSSLSKQDFICAECSVKKGRKRRHERASVNDLAAKYSYAKSSAKSNGKPFLLTKEEYVQIASRPCYYCETPSNGLGVGLDRINNDKTIGYTATNVLPCCKFCNKIRNSILTVEETMVAVKAVLELRKSKNM